MFASDSRKVEKGRVGMRIISQNRMTDIPYDSAVVFINRRNTKDIYVGGVSNDEGYPIGTYYNQDDAMYVMQLIREVRNHKYENFYMPKAEEVSSLRNELRGIAFEEGDQNAAVKKLRTATHPLS